MKKFILVILTVFVLCSVLILPAAADTPSSLDNYSNYLNENNYSQYRVYSSPDTFISQNLFNVYLKPNTTYTFLSTSGSRRFFISRPTLFNDYNSAFLYNHNYISIPYDFSYGDYTEFEITKGSLEGQIDVRSKSPLSRDYYLQYIVITLDPGTYYFNDFIPAFSSRCVSFITYGDNYIYSGDSFTLTEVTDVECRLAIYSGFDSSITLSPMLTKDFPVDFYIPGVRTILYNNQLTYIYNFTTSDFDESDNHFVIGLSDITQSISSKDLFSRYMATESDIPSNRMYLIEGSLSPEDISNIYGGQQYSDGYDEGYSEGYRLGEYEGTSAGNIFSNVLMTIFSAPMTIINNTLNFEILGVNVLMLVRIVLTILLIAFVITHLKGKE